MMETDFSVWQLGNRIDQLDFTFNRALFTMREVENDFIYLWK